MTVLGTIEEVAADVAEFAPFAPAPYGALIGAGAAAFAKVLLALDHGVSTDSIIAAVEAAELAASDAEMKAKLGP